MDHPDEPSMHEDAQIAEFRRLQELYQPHDLAWMELSVARFEHGERGLDVRMALRPAKRDIPQLLVLSFRGVMRFRFSPVSRQAYISWLAVARYFAPAEDNIHVEPDTDMKYVVWDDEQDEAIFFLCEEFELAVVGES